MCVIAYRNTPGERIRTAQYCTHRVYIHTPRNACARLPSSKCLSRPHLFTNPDTVSQVTTYPRDSTARATTLAYFTEDSLYAGFQKTVMSEVTFAKSFLATLDKRPIKLPGDHVSDPRKLPGTSPYVLPKQTHPFPRRGPAEAAQTKAKSVTVSLKPMRSGETIKLSDISLDTSVHDIKTQYAAKVGLTLDKVKILLNKKPAADLKTLNDLGVTQDVELGVMLMGGASQATTPSAAEPVTEKVATEARGATQPADEMEIDPQAPAPDSEKAQAIAEQQTTDGTETVAEILGTDEFWQDLKGFLAQRLRHQSEGERLAKVFRAAAGK